MHTTEETLNVKFSHVCKNMILEGGAYKKQVNLQIYIHSWRNMLNMNLVAGARVEFRGKGRKTRLKIKRRHKKNSKMHRKYGKTVTILYFQGEGAQWTTRPSSRIVEFNLSPLLQ